MSQRNLRGELIQVALLAGLAACTVANQTTAVMKLTTRLLVTRQLATHHRRVQSYRYQSPVTMPPTAWPHQ